ncbi:polysaccharide deacetylase family protein [Helicobacter felis]|uniref:polysaccharide deacetylase family protein n=1 Tax=Helicobacter felis TaxID=214 RepID=UPI0009D6D621|nr:polysaccharide deacetylase family protein [Helicobacter felis]
MDSSKLPKNPILLTFDDGYIDHFTVAFPILQQYGLQGSFFIPGKTIAESTLLDVNKIHFILASADVNDILEYLLERMDFYRGKEFQYASNKTLWHQYAKDGRFDTREVIFVKRMLQTVLPEELRHIISSELFAKYLGLAEDKFAKELYMNHDQIRLMKDAGMFIGFHGYDHYWLTSLSEEKIKKDIQKGLEVISPYIDEDAWVACYPFGDYNQLVRDCCQSNGCVLGLTVEVSVVDYHKHDPLLLPRLDCNDFPPRSQNKDIRTLCE